jgi:hypothetical protein
MQAVVISGREISLLSPVEAMNHWRQAHLSGQLPVGFQDSSDPRFPLLAIQPVAAANHASASCASMACVAPLGARPRKAEMAPVY